MSYLSKPFLIFLPVFSYIGVALILSPHITHAAGNTYYVATNGDDGRSCATAQNINTPRRNIGSTLTSCVQGGDTLRIRAGTYDETLDGSVANFDFWGKIRKSGIRNSMAYKLQNSRKSKFATEPLPLLQCHHGWPANPTTDATHAHEPLEETNACDELDHALFQRSTPSPGLPVR